MSRLPSLSSLLAFEATARYLSFTRAATELNVTQGAISQRIKTLEDLLGQLLFTRDGNALRLTDVGSDYLVTVRRVIGDIRFATDHTVNRERADVLTVGCLGTFALKCLLPCLGDFRARHPGIEVRLRTPIPFENSAIHDYDISIQHGFAARWPRMLAIKLEDEECFPVCSPRLLQDKPGLSVAADLAQHTVIRASSPLVPQDEWPLWLEQAGLPGLEFKGELRCDFLYPCYQAAIEGLGVAMGRRAVVRRDIAAGLLVEPFSIRMHSPLGYHLVIAPDRAELPKVKLFRDWALATLTSP